MHCTRCGAARPDDAVKCPACSARVRPYPPREIENYFIPSLLVAFFCCAVPGVIGMVYSWVTSTKFASGDFAGAEQAAKQAKQWCVIGFALTASAATLYALYVFLDLLRHP